MFALILCIGNLYAADSSKTIRSRDLATRICKLILLQMGAHGQEKVPTPFTAVSIEAEKFGNELRTEINALIPRFETTQAVPASKTLLFDSNDTQSSDPARQAEAAAIRASANEVYSLIAEEAKDPKSYILYRTSIETLEGSILDPKKALVIEANNERASIGKPSFRMPLLVSKKVAVSLGGLLAIATLVGTVAMPLIDAFPPELWFEVYQHMPDSWPRSPLGMNSFLSLVFGATLTSGLLIHSALAFQINRLLELLARRRLDSVASLYDETFIPKLEQLFKKVEEMNSSQKTGLLWLRFRSTDLFPKSGSGPQWYLGQPFTPNHLGVGRTSKDFSPIPYEINLVFLKTAKGQQATVLFRRTDGGDLFQNWDLTKSSRMVIEATPGGAP